MTLLTIREAADRTGHSTHKIRRLIKSIAEHADHADRGLIEPAPGDVDRLTAEQVQFTWRVDDELVVRMLGAGPTTTPTKGTDAAGESSGGETFQLLQRALAAQEGIAGQLLEQLKVKDSQIDGQQQVILALHERLRESNLLMASLQKQLPAPEERRNHGSSPAAVAPIGKKAKPVSPVKPGRRRSWLATIFH